MLTAGLPIAFAPLSGAAGTGVLAAEPTMGAFGALVAAATGTAEVATPATAPSQEQEVPVAAAAAASGLEASRLIRPKIAAPKAEDSLVEADTALGDAPEPTEEHEGLAAVAMATSTENASPEDTRSLGDAETDLLDPHEGAGTGTQLLSGHPVSPPSEPRLLTADDDVDSPVVDYAALPLAAEAQPALFAPTNAEAGSSLRRFVQVEAQLTPIQNAAATIPQQPPLLSPATMAASGVPEGEVPLSLRSEPNPYTYLSNSLPTVIAGQQVFVGADALERKLVRNPVSALGSVSPDALSAGAIPSLTLTRDPANAAAPGSPAMLAGQQVLAGANAEERKPVSASVGGLGSVGPDAPSAHAMPGLATAHDLENTAASEPPATLAGQQIHVGSDAGGHKLVSTPVNTLGTVGPYAFSAGASPSLSMARDPANAAASVPPVLPADPRPVSPYGSTDVPAMQHRSAVAAANAVSVASAPEPTVIDVRPVDVSVTSLQQPARGEGPVPPLTDPRLARPFSLTSTAMAEAVAPIAVQQASSVLAGVEAPATGPVSRRVGGRSNNPAPSAPTATPAIAPDGQVDHRTDAIAFDVIAQDVMSDPAAPALDLSAPLGAPLPASSERSGLMSTTSFAPGLSSGRADPAGNAESGMEAFSALASMRATRALADVVAQGREMTVRIEPAALGRIDLTVGFEANGTVRAVMAAAEPGTAELIRREAGAMALALADSGVRADAQSIRVDPSSASGQSGSSGQNGGASNAFSGHAHDSSGGQPQQNRAPAVYGDSFAAALTGEPKAEAAAGPGRARLGDQSGRRVDLIA